ncbi:MULTISPECIES: LysR family transcriptional regulator [Clostridium]|uniref:LysR family transcriptional regulator n=1 Tax=Clostridium TaxID=1485 RepID=UPI002914C39E|nr:MULTISPECIES: LysR family transcriptional regulator [Clostridium]MDU4478547.1 LysR family transcriptional regulator [Clostridium sp.]MDU4848656.1 LysR family transcriptional regulator [Clostridium sp.]CAI3192046.1 LysR family transcriptional regulator, transcriptional activator of the cysJI operon [Clostridium neonatale]CAI3201887.1 LysR family transcriptional regulator, transcriptional activator of the cysJI operon [Clostridium neonatale]CAI3693211.1 LysR family transcriptional regulator, 
MTIRHLKIFITVAECGKMRKAAELLFISQPSVSQAIRELEEHYNVKLFERISQKLHITEEGTLLLSHAQHIVDSFENMELAMKNIGKSTKIRIGGSVSVGTYLMNDIIERLENRIQNIDTFVTINNTFEIENMICRSELDVAIVEGIIKNPDIVKIPFCEDELVMVVGKAHPFYSKKQLSLSDLEGQSLLSREPGSSDRNQFEQLLAEHNINVVKKWTCTNTEAIKNAVTNGKGIAILSKMLINDECKKGKLKILRFKDVSIKRQIKLIYHKNKYISKSIEELIDICSSFNMSSK